MAPQSPGVIGLFNQWAQGLQNGFNITATAFANGTLYGLQGLGSKNP